MSGSYRALPMALAAEHDSPPGSNSKATPRREDDHDTWIDPPRDGDSGFAPPRASGVRSRRGERVAERYELKRQLGVGASGAVYEALDTHTGQPVAVKLLHEHLRASDGHVARFSREVRAMSSLEHPAIVRIRDAGEDHDHTLFLVMELLSGQLLLDRISVGMKLQSVIAIGQQLLGALAAAHRQGVVHRDIKPENLFVTQDEEGETQLKVLDFGIAKLVRPDVALSFQTLDGLILGTPEYMSPEVCRGMPVTADADLWAAGAVLFHAFAGAPPFEDTHVGRLLLRIVRERAPSLRTRRPDLPDAVIETIDRALEPDPRLRFDDALSFWESLSGAHETPDDAAELDSDDLIEIE